MAARSLASEHLRAELKNNRGRFYVYILSRPDGSPFYVGYGKSGRKPRERIFAHETEARCATKYPRQNRHKLAVIRLAQSRGEEILRSIDSWHNEETAAKQREITLIASIGRSDRGLGPLTNLTRGGEGAADLTDDGKRRRREGQARGQITRARWVKENPQELKKQIENLQACAKAWRDDNPDLTRVIRSRAGKIGGKVTAEKNRSETRRAAEIIRRVRSGESSRQWAKEHPDIATENGKKGFLSLARWQNSHPREIAEARARGGAKTAEMFRSDPLRAAITMSKTLAGREKWARNNPDKLLQQGRRQGERNRQKAEVRSRCISLAKERGSVIAVPSGRSGLAVWQALLLELQREQFV